MSAKSDAKQPPAIEASTFTNAESFYHKSGMATKESRSVLFASEVEAARAYNRAASKIFGEFAKLNEFSGEDHLRKNLKQFQKFRACIAASPCFANPVNTFLGKEK